MSEHPKRTADDAKSPASDRSIPRGTDEHSDANDEQRTDRSAGSPSPDDTTPRTEPADKR
jgi:hypothetical protein